MYNSWNFTTSYLWDSITNESYWYSKNTTLLWQSQTYMIGEVAPGLVTLDIQPRRFIHKAQDVIVSFLGIPFVALDIHNTDLYWKKAAGIDKDSKIPNAMGKFNSSDTLV